MFWQSWRKSQLFHRKEKILLFSDENFAKSDEKLTNLTDGFSSAFHTILQNFRQKKREFFLFLRKAGFFVSFVKIVCEALKVPLMSPEIHGASKINSHIFVTQNVITLLVTGGLSKTNQRNRITSKLKSKQKKQEIF
jgi:hypothetical protein